MEVQHRIIPSQEEIKLIVDIIKMVTPVDQEGITSPQLLQSIVLAMSKFGEVHIGYEQPNHIVKPLISSEKTFINKDKPNQVSVKEIITYLLEEKIIHKYKKECKVDGDHTFNRTHYSIIKIF